jgi:hypothetical protein
MPLMGRPMTTAAVRCEWRWEFSPTSEAEARVHLFMRCSVKEHVSSSQHTHLLAGPVPAVPLPCGPASLGKLLASRAQSEHMWPQPGQGGHFCSYFYLVRVGPTLKVGSTLAVGAMVQGVAPDTMTQHRITSACLALCYGG